MKDKNKKLILTMAFAFMFMAQPIHAVWSSWEKLLVPNFGKQITGNVAVKKTSNSPTVASQYKDKNAWLTMTGALSDRIGNEFYTNSLLYSGDKGTVSTSFYANNYNGRTFYLTVMTNLLDPNSGYVSVNFNPDY